MEKEYIERSEAIRKAIDACIKVVGHGITQFDAADIAEELESIPSADVEEAQHEEWEFIGDSYAKCTGCRTMFEALPTKDFFEENNPYCRHCGARMDGKVNK